MKIQRQTTYDESLFADIAYSYERLNNHKEIARELTDKQPYLITIIIENLKWNLRRRREYVKQNRYEMSTLYRELLYKYFFDEYGNENGNNKYAQWLKKYNNDDEKIVAQELESRYREAITQQFKNKERLFKSRYWLEFDRYYQLPEPLNHVDWRNPYDNIFVWQEGDHKICRRGGSGSSGQRETNSLFIFGYGLINQKLPIPSYLFVYDNENNLKFIDKFPSLTVPSYDIGSNYFLPEKERKKCLANTNFYHWNFFQEPIKEIVFDKI